MELQRKARRRTLIPRSFYEIDEEILVLRRGRAGGTADDAGRIVINDFENQESVQSNGPKSASAAAQVITFL
jgi:hypothetical protein